jgi:chromosome condensin MukBEF complex kleisin-like MukF subunit
MAMTRQERIGTHKKEYRIDSIKQAFKDDTSISVKSISQLQDDLDGATLSGEVLETAATPQLAELEACIGALGGKINSILLALKDAGIVK